MDINSLIRNKVNPNQLKQIETWTINYMQGFHDDDRKIHENLEIKKTHTLKVRNEIKFLATHIGLENDALRLAEIIGLLHDIGRFNQYKIYRTFKDSESEDHAKLGIDVLKQHQLLKDFDPLIESIIIAAISYHNKIAIPKQEIDPQLTYEKLIRDADKLDIWRVLIEHYYSADQAKNEAIEWSYSRNGDASDEVLEDIYHKRSVLLKHVQNMNDFKLLQMAWIYDLNFEITREEVIKRDYLRQIYLSLPCTKKIDDVFAFMNSQNMVKE